jgi:hypothetical protein
MHLAVKVGVMVALVTKMGSGLALQTEMLERKYNKHQLEIFSFFSFPRLEKTKGGGSLVGYKPRMTFSSWTQHILSWLPIKTPLCSSKSTELVQKS